MNIEFKLQYNYLTLLLALNIVIFILALVFDNIVGFDGSSFYLFGGQITSQIRAGDWWLLVTPNFFHIDILHFVFNLISLYRIGQIAMYYYSGRKVFLTYIFGGVAGVWLSYVVSSLAGTNVFSLGASASIFALIGLLLGGTFRKNRFGQELPFSATDIAPFIIISLLFGVMPGLNINNWAHLGGLIGGTILGLLIPNSLNKYSSKPEKAVTESLYWGALIIFIISYIALFINAYNLITQ